MSLTNLSSKNLSRINKSQMYFLEKGEFNCSDLQRLVGDYFDRELPRSLQTRVQEHIEHCPDCVQFAGSYQLVIELAREIGAERALSADFVPTSAQLEQSQELRPDVKARLIAHLNRTLNLELRAE